jgi:hypothetical protein
VFSQSSHPLDVVLSRLTNEGDLARRFTPKRLEDVMRILQCLRYVREHLPAIAEAVNQNEIGDKPGQYRNEYDCRRRLLRDEFGTSFHLDRYDSSAAAAQALSHVVQQFDYVFRTFAENQDDQHLVEFLRQLEWDNEVGCLEARTRPALEWAAIHFSSGLPTLESVIQAVQSRLAQQASSSQDISADVDLFNQVLAHCSRQQIQQVIKKTRNGNQVMSVTPREIAAYLQEVLSLDLTEEQIAAQEQKVPENKQLNIDYKRYLSFEQQAAIQRGFYGMYQYRFTAAKDASAFVAWLHEQNDLKDLAINKAKVKQENGVHVVRLTKEQFQLLQLAAPLSLEPDSMVDTVNGFQLSKRVNATKLEKRHQEMLGEPTAAQRILASLHETECDYLALSHTKDYFLKETTYSILQDLQIGLINKLSQPVIEKIAGEKDHDNWTVLHVLFRYAAPEVQQAFLVKLSPADCQRLAGVKTNKNLTVLHMLLRYAAPTTQLAFLAKLSAADCQRLAGEKNNHNSTVLHMLLRYAAPATQLAFLAKLSAADCQRLAGEKNDDNRTVLHQLLRYAAPDVQLAFLAKLSPADCQRLAGEKANDNWTVLHVLLRYAAPATQLAFLAKIDLSFAAFSDLLNGKLENQRFMRILLTSTAPALQIELFGRFHSAQWRELLQPTGPCANDFRLVLELAREPVLLFLRKQIGKAYFTALLNKAIRQDSTVFDSLLLRGDLSEAVKLALLSHLQPADLKQHFVTQNVDMYVRYRDYLANEPALIEWLVKHTNIMNPRFKQRLHADVAAGVLIGEWAMCVPEAKQQNHLAQPRLSPAPSVAAITDLRESHQLLLKVVRENNLDELLTMLQDTSKRPPLRRPRKAEDRYKFFHLTGEIKPVSGQKRQQHTHTRKTSTTLMPATDLRLRLFGDHDDSRTMVGFLFDANHCVIKARLSYDSGTYNRGWVGSLDAAKDYARSIARTNYQDPAAFHQYVDDCGSTTLNEVLAELSQAACVGIFIARDTAKAREIAITYQQGYAEKLGVMLPIILLDRTYNRLRVLQQDETHALTLKQDLYDLQLEATAKTIVRTIHAELDRFYYKGAVLPPELKKMHQQLNRAKETNQTLSLDDWLKYVNRLRKIAEKSIDKMEGNIKQLYQFILAEVSRIKQTDEVVQDNRRAWKR